MTPITWQAAVDDEEQRPLLQDILEAAVGDRRQAAVDVEEQRPQLQDIFEAAIDGNHVYRENRRGGFPLPSSRFLFSSDSVLLLLDSSIVDTSMQGSCQRQPCCHRAVMVVQECCCAFEL